MSEGLVGSEDVSGSVPGGSDYRLAGRVRFRNFMSYREAGEAAIEAATERAVIDLSGLEHSNSIAVALLMAWYRASGQHDKPIRFVGVPADLEDIIELSGLTEVLPVEAAPAGAARAVEDGR